jgi:hypothetical protein
MTLNIMLRVKFRAFFMDLAKFTKLATVTISQGNIETEVEDFNESITPASARKLVDRNGVVLKVWL